MFDEDMWVQLEVTHYGKGFKKRKHAKRIKTIKLFFKTIILFSVINLILTNTENLKNKKQKFPFAICNFQCKNIKIHAFRKEI